MVVQTKVFTIFDLNTTLCASVFQNYSMGKLVVKYVSTNPKYPLKARSAKDCLMVLMQCFCVVFSSDFIYKSICCGYLFELHRQVDAIQMGTHNICLYKEVDKKNTGCNLKTTELLDCAQIGVCAVIRSNTVLELIYFILLIVLFILIVSFVIWFQ